MLHPVDLGGNKGTLAGQSEPVCTRSRCGYMTMYYNYIVYLNCVHTNSMYVVRAATGPAGLYLAEFLGLGW